MRVHALTSEPARARAATDAQPMPMDDAAFNACYERTAGHLRAYLRRLTGEAPLADDIVQEAYIRLLQSTRPGASDGERTAFLFRAATNLVYDHWRRKRREREGLRWLGWGPAEPVPVSLGQDVSRVFETLRPRDRAVLWLTHVEGWSHAEVGQVLGLKAISVRVLLFRARKTLARQIRRAGLQPEEDRREQTR